MVGLRFVAVLSQCIALIACAVLILELEVPSLTSGSSSSPSGLVADVSDAALKEAEEPKYGRLVIMLVDALREDFVHERSEMKYVQRLIDEGVAQSFVSVAQTPTVTMPRIKALTTGGIPRFIDVMNNLDSKELRQDNLVERLHASGRKLFLYGDETWLKLFPRQFVQSDGTNSFFTKDFTEVDNNITRHFETTFDPRMRHGNARDWDCVIMHFLGMDHIGHQHGPDSPQMHDKLIEMDRVFEELHKSIQQQEDHRAKHECKTPQRSRCTEDASPLPTLLLLLSDHGMNKVGNHGGASDPETSAFLLMVHVEHTSDSHPVSPHQAVKRKRIAQVDLVPTLATLFGIGIPQQSVGEIIPEAFRTFDVSFLQSSLKANANQLSQLLLAKQGRISDEVSDAVQQRDWQRAVSRASGMLKGSFSHSSSSSSSSSSVVWTDVQLLGAVVVLAVATVFSFHGLWLGIFNSACRRLTFTDVFLLLIPLAHVLSLTSSSAIENEHVVWFFLCTSWVLLCMGKHLSEHGIAGMRQAGFRTGLLVLVLLRVLRFRLQVINFARLANVPEPDFIDEGAAVLVVPVFVRHWIVVAFVIVTYLVASIHLVFTAPDRNSSSFLRGLAVVTLFVGSALLLILKVPSQQEDLLVSARLVYGCSAALVSYAVIARLCGNQTLTWSLAFSAYVMLLLLLHRRSSTFSIGLAALLCRLLARMCVENKASSLSTVLALWCVGQCIFFSLGNSHVIATVDISGAYTGLAEYNQTLVALLTAVITFTGQGLGVLTAHATLHQLVSSDADLDSVALQSFASLRVLVATIVLIAMRVHLFIWSVFAPKWMYEALLFFFSILAFLSFALRS